MTFDDFYKGASLLISLGILAGIFRLVVWAIRLEPRLKNIENQQKAQGSLVQQFVSAQARIEGWLARSVDKPPDGETHDRDQ